MTHSIANSNGILYVVATPIGNRGDITARAVDTLRMVDCIAAEDTRHTRALLNGLGIQKKCIALHAHNESKTSMRLIDELKKGQQIALVSDAGTPLIRDPGYTLVKAAHDAGLKVVPIPGACAVITALSAAGVSSDVFTFGGFLPAASSARKVALAEFKAMTTHTLVFYESTHRLLAALIDMVEVFGEETKFVLAKELTKVFETFVRGNLTDIKAWLDADKDHIKGEFVVMVQLDAKKNASTDLSDDAKQCLLVLLKELPVKQAVKLASKITGAHRNALYAFAIAYQS